MNDAVEPAGLAVTIAIGEYDYEWPTLVGAPESARDFSTYMRTAGFAVQERINPARSDVIELLSNRTELASDGFRGPLILIWTGHGHVLAEELSLIVRDTPTGPGLEDSAYEPKSLLAYALDAGSLDTLLIIDTCFSGAADGDLIESQLSRLENGTWAGSDPKLSVIVSCKGYEKALDGAFLGALLTLLRNGPDLSVPGQFDLCWSEQQPTVPLLAVLDRLAWLPEGKQRPRSVALPGTRIQFPNPRFVADASPALVADRLRALQGIDPASTPMVETPAMGALRDRLARGPGLWVVTGPAGSGKSTCFGWVATKAIDCIAIAARAGREGILAALDRAGDDKALLLDAFDEVAAGEQLALADLATRISRGRFVAVSTRPTSQPAPARSAISELITAAEQLIDLSDEEWVGDAVYEYTFAQLLSLTRPANEGGRTARVIAQAAADTGLGFLLARVVTDQVVEGMLDPDSQDFADRVSEQAAELVLSDWRRDTEPSQAVSDRALLRAMAIMPRVGVPLGAVWEEAARGIDPDADSGLQAQVSLLNRLSRFVVDDRAHGEAVYRFFHPILREQFRSQVTDSTEDWLDGTNERVILLIHSLAQLRRQQSVDFSRVERTSPYLAARLPELIASCRPATQLALDATMGAPDEIILDQVRAVIGAVEEQISLDNEEQALLLSSCAMEVAGQVEDAQIIALVSNAEALASSAFWREAPSVAESILELVKRGPSRLSSIRLDAALRATTVQVRASWVDEIDDELHDLLRILERTALAEPETFREIAGALIDLLIATLEHLHAVISQDVATNLATVAAQVAMWSLSESDSMFESRRIKALTRRGFERTQAGDLGGFDDLAMAADWIFEGTRSPAVLADAAGVLGELVQGLALDGQHDRARFWLDRFRAELHVQFESERIENVGHLLSQQLAMLAAVNAAVGDDEGALICAQNAVKVQRTIEETGGKPGVTTDVILTSAALNHFLAGDLEQAAILVQKAKQLPSGPAHPRLLHRVAALVHSRMASDQFSAVPLFGLRSALEEQAVGFGQPARILFAEFCVFGVELDVGGEIARLEHMQGRPFEAEKALDRACELFLDSIRLGSPRRLLNLRPDLLAQHAVRLDRMAKYTSFDEAHYRDWQLNLHRLALSQAQDPLWGSRSDAFETAVELLRDEAGETDARLTAFASAELAPTPQAVALFSMEPMSENLVGEGRLAGSMVLSFAIQGMTDAAVGSAHRLQRSDVGVALATIRLLAYLSSNEDIQPASAPTLVALRAMMKK